MTRRMTLEERILSRIERLPECGCWIWMGATIRKEYGTIGSSPFTDEVLVHRISWILFKGPIPEGAQVLHHCDTPPCINPDHLFLGSNQDNVDDKMQKGRFKPVIGANHGMAFLIDEQVLEIRRRYAAGERQVDLADAFGTNRQRIYQIVHRKQWKHI